jgi:hypothetical protein
LNDPVQVLADDGIGGILNDGRKPVSGEIVGGA